MKNDFITDYTYRIEPHYKSIISVSIYAWRMGWLIVPENFVFTEGQCVDYVITYGERVDQ
jgi:hypothetical protein